MFAQVDQIWLVLLIIIAFGVCVGLGVLIVKWHRRFVAAADRAQRRAFEGMTVSPLPAPGLVEVVFHVYCGILAFTHQIEHRFWATPDEARLILARLNRFNLTWGFFAYGAVFIPVLSIGNYLAQRSRISRQAATLGT